VTGEQALILPCLGRTERDTQATGEQIISCENSMGVVQSSHGTLSPASPHLRSEVSIICHVAAATLAGRTSVDWLGLAADYNRIREHIERVIPGFENYKQEFNTDVQRAKFFVHPIPKIELQPGELLMMSLRSHDQFNTTIYGENDRYRGIYGGRRVIFLNRDDIHERGLSEGQWVDLTSHFNGCERRVEGFLIVPYEIPRGCAATYYPETNPLVPINHVAEGSNQPASKSIVITIAPSKAQANERRLSTPA
jgi:anaerobic selenocysteine-containing dehydrogenase